MKLQILEFYFFSGFYTNHIISTLKKINGSHNFYLFVMIIYYWLSSQ